VLGMFAAAGAIFCFTVMNAFAKHLSATHSVIEIGFYRNAFACIPFFAAAFLFGQRQVTAIQTKPKLVITRAVLGTVSLVITFYAYSLMPMAETAVLLFTASLFLPVLGVLILKEHVGPYRWSAVVVGFIGVALMVNPTGNVNVPGVAAALTAAFMQAFLSVLLRHLGSHERPETLAFYFFVIGTIMTGCALPFVGFHPSVAELPYFIGVGLAGAAAQWLLATALRYTRAAIMAVFNYTAIVWAMLFGWLIWHEWPLPIVFAGSAIVITANVLIVWRESRLREPHLRTPSS